MQTIAVSIPSGAHHRSLLQPLRELLLAETTWNFLVISPGAPFADELFAASDYPRARFGFVENAQAAQALASQQPILVVTTTAGLDPADVSILEAAKRLGLGTATFIESWDNVWKMERVQRGLGRTGQRIVLADHLLVWNEIMRRHLLRAFPMLRPDQITVTGAPRLDYFGPRYDTKRPTREVVLTALGLDPIKPLLHLATTELYDHAHVAQVIADAKRRGDLPATLQLYASVHPGGNLERHRSWAERYGYTLRYSPGRRDPTFPGLRSGVRGAGPAPHPDFRYHPTEDDMLQLASIFRETAVLVNLSSTVALESCLADRPTICAFFGKPFDWFRWNRSMVVRDFREHYADLVRGGGIAIARNPRALVSQITEYWKNPAADHAGRIRSAERIATTLAGDATKRVLEVLRRLCA